MSSTQDPTNSTDSTQPAQQTPPTDSSTSSASSTPSQPVTISVDMMLYEAGMIANSLSSKTLGSALAQRLFEAEQEAEDAKKSDFTFAFSPFEAGMALDGMSRTADGSLDDLKRRLGQALSEVMQELGIQPLTPDGGAVGGSVGGDTSSQQDNEDDEDEGGSL